MKKLIFIFLRRVFLLISTLQNIQCKGNILNPFDDMSEIPTRTKSKLPSLDNVKYYAHFTAAADYQNHVNDWTCKPCMDTGEGVKLIKIINNRLYNTRAIVTTNKIRKEIVITFRGTTNVRNVIDDLIVLKRNSAGLDEIKVHLGSWLAMKSLYTRVTKTLRNQLKKHSKYNVIVAGHSLGGMEASLFFFELRTNTNEFKNLPFELYTYGTPRVGNLNFVLWMNSHFKIVRVVNKSDIIPHLTTSSSGYVHFNTEVWIQKSGETQICSRKILEDPNCSNSKGPIYNFIPDHLSVWDTDYSGDVKQNPLSNVIDII